MKYIFVGPQLVNKNSMVFENDIEGQCKFIDKKSIDFSPLIANITDYSLISIISGLTQKNFGIDTLKKCITEIRRYKDSFCSNKLKLYIDSGGYSIIVGDVLPSDILKFMECYNFYLENEKNFYDYIFSLDIPVFLEYPKYNTKQAIYKLNKLSLDNSVKILDKYEEIRNKFYFVYQFKIKGQYEIWSHLYDELNLKNYINCWAIGGMVGLRGFLKNYENTNELKFSPFTALAYKSFFDYLNTSMSNPFRLHMLGIYIKYDRFQIILLEKLFRKYLQNNNITLTYDSINYFRTAQLKARDIDIFYLNNNELNIFNSKNNIPENILKTVYSIPEYYNFILEEYDRLRNNKILYNINSFVPLFVFSNIQLDLFFDFIIEKYQIHELFFNTNYDIFKNKINIIFSNLTSKYPNLFTPIFITNVKENLRITYIFHNWFINNRKRDKLDFMITEFIKKINFPLELT